MRNFKSFGTYNTTLSDEIRFLREKLFRAIIWSLPKQVIYWASIRMIAYATGGKYGHTIVPELSAMDALGRWEDLMSNG